MNFFGVLLTETCSWSRLYGILKIVVCSKLISLYCRKQFLHAQTLNALYNLRSFFVRPEKWSNNLVCPINRSPTTLYTKMWICTPNMDIFLWYLAPNLIYVNEIYFLFPAYNFFLNSLTWVYVVLLCLSWCLLNYVIKARLSKLQKQGKRLADFRKKGIFKPWYVGRSHNMGLCMMQTFCKIAKDIQHECFVLQISCKGC